MLACRTNTPPCLACTAAITYIFVVEMGAKLYGLSWAGYWSDGWNKLDGSIVLISLIEMVLTMLASGTGVRLSFLRVLRLLRVLRVLRLMRSWRGLHRVVTTFGNALPEMSNVIVLMLLLMQIFALIGMQIIGGQYNPLNGFSDVPCPAGLCPDPELEELPRAHFDYFAPAVSTVFVVMSGEVRTSHMAHGRLCAAMCDIHAQVTCKMPLTCDPNVHSGPTRPSLRSACMASRWHCSS